MRVISFREKEFAGEEEALVAELAKKDGMKLSVLQECNDSGELIHAQFLSEVEYDSVGNAKVCQSNMNFLRLKRALRSRGVISFVSVDNFVEEKVMVTSQPQVRSTIYAGEVEDARAKKILFIGDGIEDRRVGLAVGFKEGDSVICQAIVRGVIMELLFPCSDLEEAKKLKERVQATMAGGKVLVISGMEMPEAMKDKGGHVYMKRTVLVNQFRIYEDTFKDIEALMPYLNSFEDFGVFRDSGTGELLYPEVISTLLFFSTAYVRYGEPPFNIILSGIPGSAKTGCLKLMSKVFSNDGKIIGANMCTAKGLVPSYGDVPHPGLLIEPENFVKVVDEFFRRAEKEARSRGQNDPTPFVYNFLMEAMNVVERREDVLAGSGKGQLPPGTFMRDSLIATDNLNEGVKSALSTAVAQDRAIMRRFTFVLIGRDEVERVRMAKESPADNEVYDLVDEQMKKRGYTLKQMGRFARWFRREVGKVRLDREMCKSATEGLLKEMLAKLLGISEENEVIGSWVAELNLIPYYEAFLRCCVLSRYVFAVKEMGLPEAPYKISLFDYIEAERYFRKLFGDTLSIYRGGLVEAAAHMSQGVKRAFGGFIDG